jgi:prepilin-type N-terminal cleavage/methylation domain-containing protein
MNGERIRRGFTLIEMLAVIAIIAILAGIVFKMMAFANRKASEARTIAILEKVANALTEFKAEYGQYPPVASNACPFSGTHYHPEDPYQQKVDCRVCYSFFCNIPENKNFQSQVTYLKAHAADYDTNSTVYAYGLVAFLVERAVEGLPPENNLKAGDMAQWVPDTGRDLRAKMRWKPFVESVTNGPYLDLTIRKLSGQNTDYRNKYYTIYDGYSPNHLPIMYKSDPPYQTYELWAAGPDRRYGTADDTHKGTWDNK